MNTEIFSLTGLTGVFSRNGVMRVLRYDSGAATGGVTPTIRVRSIPSGLFDIEMNPGRTVTLSKPANGLIITNISAGADILGKFTYGDGSVADDAVVGSVALDSATLAAIAANKVPYQHTGSFSDAVAAVANTAQTIFAPAANAAGVILLGAAARTRMSPGIIMKFICHNAAPTTIHQGVTLAQGRADWIDPGGTQEQSFVETDGDIYIPAGSGLYFIANGASLTGSAEKFARWRTL